MSSLLPAANNSSMSYYHTLSESIPVDALTRRQVKEYQKEAYWRTHCEWSEKVRKERQRVEEEKRLRDVSWHCLLGAGGSCDPDSS